MGIEANAVAEQAFAIQVAENEVGIGNRWLFTPEPVAGRPRVGPGTVGPDPNRLALDTGDRATPGAN